MWQNLNRLFSVPKGFGKFFPKGQAAPNMGTAGKKSATGSAKVGGGGGRKPEFSGPDGPQMKFIGTALGGVAVITYIATRDKTGK